MGDETRYTFKKIKNTLTDESQHKKKTTEYKSHFYPIQNKEKTVIFWMTNKSVFVKVRFNYCQKSNLVISILKLNLLSVKVKQSLI